MLLSPLNKKTLLGLFCILAIFIAQPSYAKKVSKSCEFQAFNIKTNETLTISEVVNELANKCHFSVIAKDPESNRMLATPLNGLNIRKMSLHEVFNLILTENGINYTYKRGVLRLSSLMTKTFKLDYITSVREGTANITASSDVEIKESGATTNEDSNADNEIKVRERFDFWQTLNTELVALLNNGSESYQAQAPIINKNSGLITITATKSQLDRVASYIKELKNRLHKQVMIDVSIIEVTLGNEYSTGINWSKFGLTIGGDAGNTGATLGTRNTFDRDGVTNITRNLSIVSNMSFSMTGLMNFIKEKGDSRVLSNPKVITLNNQQALITIGDNINYRVQEDSTNDESGNTTVTYTPYTIFIGVMLNLLPEVSDDNKIMLRINPSLSDFKYAADDAIQTAIREVAPDTKEKKLSTVVQVNSGDTIILGGLIDQEKTKNKTSVPVLSDIPLLGGAFKSTSDKTDIKELVFVITPHIINAGEAKPIGTSLKDLGFSESIYE